ncbi:hypothetical protein ACP4OV_025485 [Aristida adscensionis]
MRALVATASHHRLRRHQGRRASDLLLVHFHCAPGVVKG